MLDVLHDLRSKRLWPLAAGLALAILAVPALVFGLGAPVHPAPTAVAPEPGPAAGALPSKVVVSQQPEGGSSELGTFDPHNPFRPKVSKADVKNADQTTSGSGEPASSGAAAQATPATPDASDSKASASSQSGNTAKTPKTPKLDPTPTTPVDNGKGGGNGQKSKQGNNDSNRTRLLAYEVDAAYGPGGRAKSHTLRPTDVFPRKQQYFLFSGVTNDGREGVFTVLEDTLVADRGGEGHCKQVNGRCQVLYLRDGQARRFKDSRGNTYVLRLADINVVEKALNSLTGKLADTVD